MWEWSLWGVIRIRWGSNRGLMRTTKSQEVSPLCLHGVPHRLRTNQQEALAGHWADVGRCGQMWADARTMHLDSLSSRTDLNKPLSFTDHSIYSIQLKQQQANRLSHRDSWSEGDAI